MKMYNEHTDVVEELPLQHTTEGGVLVYLRRLNETQLNDLGWYNITTETKPDSRYYNSVENSELIGNIYTIMYTSTELPLVDVKTRMLKSISTSHSEHFTRPRVLVEDLGFYVDGGLSDEQTISIGKDLGVLVFRDADDETHDIVIEDYDTILAAIREAGTVILKAKWDKKDEVKLLESIDTCKLFEYTPIEVPDKGTVYINRCTYWDNIKW